jgi:hypothetical protein
VNSAEPWVRGSTPERMVIGRTVRVSRPSMRGSPTGCGRERCGFDFEEQVADGFSSGAPPSPVHRLQQLRRISLTALAARLLDW